MQPNVCVCMAGLDMSDYVCMCRLCGDMYADACDMGAYSRRCVSMGGLDCHIPLCPPCPICPSLPPYVPTCPTLPSIHHALRMSHMREMSDTPCYAPACPICLPTSRPIDFAKPLLDKTSGPEESRPRHRPTRNRERSWKPRSRTAPTSSPARS